MLLEASAHDEMALRPSDIGLVSFSGLSEPCSVGSIVEVVVSDVLLAKNQAYAVRLLVLRALHR